MNDSIDSFGKFWLELWGRNRPPRRFPFPDNEIITPGHPTQVSLLWNAIYLNLHPTQYAVGIAPDGRLINLKGGYNYPLAAGRYILHYVDKQNRVSVIPRVSETTLDGSQVSLEVVITYRVTDPIKALEVQQPVNTLFIFIQSDLKEFIRSHAYDEIVGGSDGRKVDNSLVAHYIKEQHAGRHQMSKLFFIADIVVEERVGDPRLTQIREDFQAEQRQNVVKAELTKQNKDLEQKVASQEAEIKRIKAESDAKQQEIQQRMSLQLENARAQLRYKQEQMNRAMEAIGKAVSTQGYPRDPREVEIIRELLGALGNVSGSDPDVSARPRDSQPTEPGKPSSSNRIDTLTDMLLSLSERRRS